MGETVTFAANGHTTAGYLAAPGAGQGLPVLVIQEWWGLVDHIKDVADRFATEGFLALAPDFYAGQTTRSPDQAAKLFMALNIDRAGADLRGAAKYLGGRPEATSRRVGVVGFCMGGQLALFAATVAPDEVGAVVDFYGIHPKVPIDPARVKAPVLGHFGERDGSVSRESVETLARQVRQAGGRFEAHFYDADHAFFNDTRGDVYRPDAARTAWDRTVAFLRTHLAG
jgi:carboxymethylenebutenolidase